MNRNDPISLDATDYRILRELNADGRLSDVGLSERVQLSGTAVARRRKNLEEAGAIRGYSTDLDFGRLGFGIVVIEMMELIPTRSDMDSSPPLHGRGFMSSSLCRQV